ncbi:hypothetical protein D0T53_10175 [Dysgonomonas sp. 216]|uniref:hypothetical protein n=1 Tax=Dysgonomonas sp. 216 TaxID=2302934 RepID=UPI0013D3BFC0|nr:hypothetical protein [Dysgonomonas sp. 216]NDW19278.1 hypothetical protein [Dysgonomonas sp. 216]
MKNKVVAFYQKYADKVVHKDVGAWLIAPIFTCDLFSLWWWMWLTIAIVLPFANELRDKYKKNGTGFSIPDLLATYAGEMKMLGVYLIMISI